MANISPTGPPPTIAIGVWGVELFKITSGNNNLMG